MEKPATIRHPRPQNAERCRRWLQFQCFLGYDCKYVHGDLEYDDDVPVRHVSLSCDRGSDDCVGTTDSSCNKITGSVDEHPARPHPCADWRRIHH